MKSVDACDKGYSPPRTEDQVTLGQDDVFYLIDSLGMREPREKSPADLFGNNPVTRNHDLAELLGSTDVNKRVYYLGMPTSALLVLLAGKLASGNDSGALSKLGATDAPCRTAGISAVMAQQPFIPGGTEKPIGRELLATKPIRTITQLFSVTSGKKVDGCIGDEELSAHRLGRSFQAVNPGLFSVPAIDRSDNPLNDSEIVNVALSWSSWPPPAGTKRLQGEPAVLAFMRNISSEASGVLGVRHARVAANFFVGWERLAILIVATFLALCLLWQQAMNIVDVNDLRYIRYVKEAAGDDQRLLLASLRIADRLLHRSVGRSAPREILSAALEVADQQKVQNRDVDYDRVHRAAEHEARIMERNQFFFLAGLPLLPTIGFIGTVRSLIGALAIADNIPRARDAVDQVAAVTNVTSTLALCFSTTFMALTALLIFAPLDLWQATGERRVIEESERLLDPGL